MTQVPNKFNIPVAIRDHSNQDLSSNVIMSHDFGVLNPLMCRMMVPGDHFVLNPEFFTYLAPLSCPTFGDIKLTGRAFFVPFRILLDDWKDFISSTKKPNIRIPEQMLSPKLKTSTVSEFTDGLFFNANGSVNTKIINKNGSRKDVLITFIVADDYVSTTFELTYLGRQLLSVLRGLGYNIPFVVNGTYNSSSYVLSRTSFSRRDIRSDNSDLLNLFDSATTQLSLLPLVGFWRFYLDWIIPSRFIQQNPEILRLITLFRAEDSVLDSDSGLFTHFPWFNNYPSGQVDYPYVLSSFLRLCFRLPTVYLSDDFFTSAFANPFGFEDDSSLKGMVISQPDDYHTFAKVTASSTNGGAEIQTQRPDSDSTIINMFSLRTLGALQDMINRGKVAGSKIQDYLKVTYGIEPGSSALDISTYLGSHSENISIGSVSSNADTYNSETHEGATLGQFGGRGLGGSDNFGKFEFIAKEHGLFFFTCELSAKTSYWQGLRPECMLVDKFDFFQPEFDAKGCEAIPQKMLNFAQGLNEDDDSFNEPFNISPNQPFGFTSQYSKLKVSFDSLLGDFRVGGLNKGYDSWYLARFLHGNQNINENFSRMVQNNTSVEYDHIFQLADNSADHFYTAWKLKLSAPGRPMKPLTEVLEFEDKSGKDVDVSFNGSVNS